jgi:hypothetical protein
MSSASIDLADLVDVQVERGDAEHGQETPFDKLVLPPGHKQMIQSLIAQHFRDKESGKGRNEQVDFVRGKGTYEVSVASVTSSKHPLRQGFDPSSPWSSRCWENKHSR